MLTCAVIIDRLGLPAGAGEQPCIDYLSDRPLTIEPVIRPVLGSRLVGADAERAVLAPLRLFRAAVRGLDDLLDASPREPGGRPAAWARYGRGTTAASAVMAWERSIEAAPSEAVRAAMLAESEAMLTAAELEAAAGVASASARMSVADLRALELRIRDKEIAYWRLVFAMIAGVWRGPEGPLRALRARMVQCGHVFQRLDDARDFREDLTAGRLSSFMLELLAVTRGRRRWGAHIERLVAESGDLVEAYRAARCRALERARAGATRRVGEVATMALPADDDEARVIFAPPPFPSQPVQER